MAAGRAPGASGSARGVPPAVEQSGGGKSRSGKPDFRGALLQDRFRVSRERPAFADSDCEVRKARDTKDSRDVWVKFYKGVGPLDLQKFRRSVELLLTFRGRFTEKGGRRESSSELDLILEELRSSTSLSDYGAAHSFMAQMNFRSFFPELITYSHDQDWNPEPDPSTGWAFVVIEMGEMSLRERMSECAKSLTTLSLPELRNIHWSLVNITCGLQTEGYMHLNVNPNTIFRFKTPSGEPIWKLIDLNGVIRTGQQVRAIDLVYTPDYVAPELAQAVLRTNREGGRVTVTRSMAVWSAGMIALETIALMPAYDVKFSWLQQWKDKEGKKANTFLASVAGEQSRSLGTEQMINKDLAEAIRHLNVDLLLLLEGMLTRDVKQRAGIAKCLLNRFFAGMRKAVLDSKWHIGEDDDEPPLPGEAKAVEDAAAAEKEDVIGPDISAYIKEQIARRARDDAEDEARKSTSQGLPALPAGEEAGAARPAGPPGAGPPPLADADGAAETAEGAGSRRGSGCSVM